MLVGCTFLFLFYKQSRNSKKISLGGSCADIRKIQPNEQKVQTGNLIEFMKGEIKSLPEYGLDLVS